MTTSTPMPARPLPAPTPETQHFWDGTALGELRLQRCGACSTTYFPPQPFCPACSSDDVTVVQNCGVDPRTVDERAVDAALVADLGAAGALDHPVGAGAHLRGGLAAGRVVRPHRPARHRLADLRSGQALVFAVVPLDQVVVDLCLRAAAASPWLRSPSPSATSR